MRTGRLYFVFRVIGDDHTDEECQTNQCSNENKDMNEDRMLLDEGEAELVSIEVKDPQTHQTHSIHDDITNLEPTFQRENFEQSQHRTSNVVEIEVVWISPRDEEHQSYSLSSAYCLITYQTRGTNITGSAPLTFIFDTYSSLQNVP